MQSVRKIISAELLAPIISLPKELRKGEAEVIVLPWSSEDKRAFRAITEDRKSAGYAKSEAQETKERKRNGVYSR